MVEQERLHLVQGTECSSGGGGGGGGGGSVEMVVQGRLHLVQGARSCDEVAWSEPKR